MKRLIQVDGFWFNANPGPFNKLILILFRKAVQKRFHLHWDGIDGQEYCDREKPVKLFIEVEGVKETNG